MSNCYKNNLKLAEIHHLKSVAFPNISTGVYGFPKRLAAEVAMKRY
ncbi:MAG: macro domain-containing protein [Gelidibacter sp.]